jgi:hypothetical protein
MRQRLLPVKSAFFCILIASFLLSVNAGPQFTTWINNLLAEKGVDKYKNSGEDGEFGPCQMIA